MRFPRSVWCGLAALTAVVLPALVGVATAPASAATPPVGGQLEAPAAQALATAPTPPTQGYWEVAADGGLFTYGGAQFQGSMGGHPLNKPVVGMASAP